MNDQEMLRVIDFIQQTRDPLRELVKLSDETAARLEQISAQSFHDSLSTDPRQAYAIMKSEEAKEKKGTRP
jgi:hypothetical protein